MRAALDGRQAQIWTAGPGIVKAVDMTTMTLSVQPAIKGQVTDENGNVIFVNLPLLIHVPIQFPVAGGFALTLPVAVEDEVLVVWAARCIDAWWQNGGIQKPMEARMHDLSDGFAIVGICSVPNVIPSISTTGAQLRNMAGTSYVELSSDGKIKLVSPVGVEVDGNLKVTGTIKGPLDIDLLTHKHGGVTVGGGSTGVPVP